MSIRWKLSNGNTFNAFPDGNEFYGWQENERGGIVKGSGGWWRTLDAVKLKERVEFHLDVKVIA